MHEKSVRIIIGIPREEYENLVSGIVGCCGAGFK
jgi:hypothetical protein